MKFERMYRRTSIGRPLDPAWPTNRAVIVLIPIAVVIGGAAALLRGVSPLAPALAAGLTAFLSWALARELAPDHDLAAFLAMALAVTVTLFVAHPALVLLFNALLLVRMVNRSTGLAARPTDSTGVVALTLFTCHATHSLWPAFTGALAFVLDALLPPPARHQFAFAALCLAGALLMRGSWALEAELHTTAAVESAIAAVVALAFVLSLLRTRRVASVGDATNAPLRPARVRGGMVVGLLLAAATLGQGDAPVSAAAGLWATLAAVALWLLLRLPAGLGHNIPPPAPTG